MSLAALIEKMKSGKCSSDDILKLIEAAERMYESLDHISTLNRVGPDEHKRGPAIARMAKDVANMISEVKP